MQLILAQQSLFQFIQGGPLIWKSKIMGDGEIFYTNYQLILCLLEGNFLH